MIYKILKVLMRITVRIFFKSITIKNRELIPKNGPLLVLANHPSTFMDPIVIATMLDFDVYFLAKGELFKSKFAQWLLPKFNMIPVYRKQDDPSQMSKNVETFDKCYEHLERGGALLIFPEGTSITERKLRPIKTGAARIVLGAEARNNFSLNIQVVAMGLNYANPHRFNRDLFVNVAKPLHAGAYKNSYSQDTFAGAQQLTEDIRVQMESLIIAIEDAATDELVKNIELVYKHRLQSELGMDERDKDAAFTMTKNIVESVRYYAQHDPAKVKAITLRINNYLHNLRQLGIKDRDLQQNNVNKTIIGDFAKALLLIIVGFPFYVYGLLNNYLPFKIPGWVADRVAVTKEFKGAIGMVLGMFTFLIFYIVQLKLCWHLTQNWLETTLYFVSLPLSGIVAYWYYYKVAKIRANWILVRLFYKNTALVAKLVMEREAILHEFDEARNAYLKSNP